MNGYWKYSAISLLPALNLVQGCATQDFGLQGNPPAACPALPSALTQLAFDEGNTQQIPMATNDAHNPCGYVSITTININGHDICLVSAYDPSRKYKHSHRVRLDPGPHGNSNQDFIDDCRIDNVTYMGRSTTGTAATPPAAQGQISLISCNTSNAFLQHLILKTTTPSSQTTYELSPLPNCEYHMN